MISFDNFFAAIPESDKVKIVQDAEILRRTGAVGDGALREYADRWVQSINTAYDVKSNCLMADLVMMAGAAYRYFALKYLEN